MKKIKEYITTTWRELRLDAYWLAVFALAALAGCEAPVLLCITAILYYNRVRNNARASRWVGELAWQHHVTSLDTTELHTMDQAVELIADALSVGMLYDGYDNVEQLYNGVRKMLSERTEDDRYFFVVRNKEVFYITYQKKLRSYFTNECV